MRSIEKLVPRPGGEDGARLRGVAPDRLARYAADPQRPWWRRRPCVLALAGRVPAQRVDALVARLRDPDDVAEVRIVLLDLLADRADESGGVGRADLLSWLRHPDRRDERYGVAEAVLRARGVLGDLTAVPELTTLAASPWRHRAVLGEAGLDALVDRYGPERVLAGIGEERPEDRAFRILTRHRADEDVTDALADPDREVAFLARSLLGDPERIRRYLAGAPTVEAALWAAYALYGLTDDAAETRAVHAALGRPRVEVPGLAEDVRRAIVHEYAASCTPASDPRWRVEALCTDPPARPDEDGQLRRASAALTAAGLAPEPPVDCGTYHDQGEGTYHVIAAGGREFLVSTLGPFASVTPTGDDADPGGTGAAARGALAAAGFRWIDEDAGAVLVDGLCVYYFGSRAPLTVDTLLFHWQD